MLHTMLMSLSTVMAPILPHMAEDVWQTLPFKPAGGHKYVAVFFVPKLHVDVAFIRTHYKNVSAVVTLSIESGVRKRGAVLNVLKNSRAKEFIRG